MATSAQFHIVPPENFDFRALADWPKWIKRFERFRVASELCNKSEDSQVNMLYCMGSEADEMLESFALSAEDIKKYSVVKSRFDKFFTVKKNIIYERAKIFKRRQQSGEPADVFINDVFKMAESCNLRDLKDELVTTVLVIGVADDKLSESLQMDQDLTSARAVTRIRQAELVRNQQTLVRAQDAMVETVQHSKSQPDFKRRYRWNKETAQQEKAGTSNVSGSSPNITTKCSKCGGKPNHHWSKCPANKAKCYRCGQVGHYGRCCAHGEVQELESEHSLCHASSQQSPSGPREYYLGEVALEICSQPWYVKVKLFGTELSFKVDTGADVTVIGEHVCRDLKVTIGSTNKKLFGAGKNSIDVVGTTMATLSYGNQEVTQEIFVVKEQMVPLLGRPAIKALDIMSVKKAEEVTESKPCCVDKFLPLFEGLGQFRREYNIQLQEGAKPYAVIAPRRVPFPLRNKVKEELDRMVHEGVITSVEEPTEWCAPMVVVPKKDGSVRICVDFTQLNRFILRERLQLPSVEESLAQLQDAKWFSVLDASSGFWQIPLSPASAPYTTFITPFGRFYFNRLPFGIKSGPEHYQRQMQHLVWGMPGVVNQADDILVCGRTAEEHDQRLEAVLGKLVAHGVTLNKAKCRFRVKTVKFLGHVISEGTVGPDADKTKAVSDMPEPTNVTEVRRFLGMVTYLMKFIPNLAEKTQPLRVLLCQDTDWVWDAPQRQAVRNLKEEIAQLSRLALYQQGAQVRVLADASSFGLGSVLEQYQQGAWKPVAFASRSLSEAESRYAQVEKEALALTWSCEKFRNYVLGTRFIILTDHKPLVQLLTSTPLTELTARLQRMRMRLMCYDYTIEHVAGKTFFVPDALSRAPVDQPGEGTSDIVEEELFVEAVVRETPFSDVALQTITEAQDRDDECQVLKDNILQGFSSKHSHFWQYRGQLTYSRGLITLHIEI
ncbi:uncharacterized protein LOC134537322 [Bacillus rossius redtenbacheri]|uniref:uncharacterized protein LOC134537322 n=1 Tax=Bacillus rossius redtenbacheri TaxID=93214 RepID=UPI002FDD05A2